MQFFRPSLSGWVTASLVAGALLLGAAGCQSQSSALTPSGTLVKSGDPIPAGKVAVEAPPNTAAQAMGGSGLPVTTGSPAGAGAQPKVLVDAPANTNAQSMGGSGMPTTPK